MANTSDVTIYDGSQDWSSGIDSVKLPTIQSTDNPNGLLRSELAWLSNGTVRDGGITQRATWQPLKQLYGHTGLWQGGEFYVPDNAFPYLMFSVSGKIYRVDVDSGPPVLLSTTPTLTNPALEPYGYFGQGEQFMVRQAGDNVTVPLIWDGVTLRRSDGLTKNLGISTADFTAPPQLGDSTLITLAAPFWKGYTNQVFTINGDLTAKWIQVRGAQFITLKNTGASASGSIIAAGTSIVNPAGASVSKLISQFTIPATGASNNVFVTPAYPGAVNDNVTIGGQAFQITAIGIPEVANPQIRAVNLSQTVGTVNTHPVSLTSIQEITAASPMDYFQGRLWYAIGRQFLAGDIVRGPSGTAFYDFRDSILKVTENPLVLAGDGFTVPDNSGNIRSLFHNANINVTLGQGNLYIGTSKAIYSLDVPTTRADWIKADNSNQPKQTVVQINNGTVNDRSCTKVNGDVWYQTLEPSIASLSSSVRNFSQWGTISLSANVNRILQFSDRALLKNASGCYFNNRMLQTALPIQKPQGIIHQAIVPLDFVPMSQYGASLTPNWEGSYSGLDVLQMWTADFGGRERCFAAVVSRADSSIWLWELSTAGQFEDGDKRVEWYFETPAWTFGDIFQLKKLVSAELGFDRIFGTVEFKVDYRPDYDSCWHTYHQFQVCSARNSCESVDEPQCYPTIPFCEGYRQSVTLPKPQLKCEQQTARPVNIGYQFQFRITIKGFCRFRGLRVLAEEVEQKLYHNITC